VLLQNWSDAPLVFFLPKSTDTTITELCIVWSLHSCLCVHDLFVCLQNWNNAPLVFFLPKSTDTTITELCRFLTSSVTGLLLLLHRCCCRTGTMRRWCSSCQSAQTPPSQSCALCGLCILAYLHDLFVCLQNWNDAPLVFFLPKSTDTTITELCIENMVRPSVFATAVVPLEDMKKYSGGKGGTGMLHNTLSVVI
jgi:hypothetical protein